MSDIRDYSQLRQENERLREELSRDRLTGVFDRSAMAERVDAALKEGPGTLIVVDIMNFRRVNEKYGYRVGDDVLIRFSEILCRMVLQSDLVGRVDGDVFVIFIRGERPETFLRERADQIGKRVVNQEYGPVAHGDIRISSGIAAWHPGDDYQRLLCRAENDLLTQKIDLMHYDNLYRRSILADGKSIRERLMLKQPIKGAYRQSLENFEILYRYMERVMKRNGTSSFILLLTLSDADGGMPRLENREVLMSMLGDTICDTLRATDVFTRYSSVQYLVMNTESDTRYAETIAERVRAAFYERVGGRYTELLLHEYYPMGEPK